MFSHKIIKYHNKEYSVSFSSNFITRGLDYVLITFSALIFHDLSQYVKMVPLVHTNDNRKDNLNL